MPGGAGGQLFLLLPIARYGWKADGAKRLLSVAARPLRVGEPPDDVPRLQGARARRACRDRRASVGLRRPYAVAENSPQDRTPAAVFGRHPRPHVPTNVDCCAFGAAAICAIALVEPGHSGFPNYQADDLYLAPVPSGWSGGKARRIDLGDPFFRLRNRSARAEEQRGSSQGYIAHGGWFELATTCWSACSLGMECHGGSSQGIVRNAPRVAIAFAAHVRNGRQADISPMSGRDGTRKFDRRTNYAANRSCLMRIVTTSPLSCQS